MDIETKERFLETYDKLTKNLIEGKPDTFANDFFEWLDYLRNSNIVQVEFVIDALMRYANFEIFEYHVTAYFESDATNPFAKEDRKLYCVLGDVEDTSHFWNDFQTLLFKCYDVQAEKFNFNEISYTVFLSKFENVSVSLREIFEKSHRLTNAGPNVNRDEQREIPASDRVVKIDHNAPEYQEIIEKLEELEASISKSNSIENEDKDRLQAELKAGEGILKGKTARIEVIKTLLVKGLKYIIKHVANAAIVFTAEYLLKLIFQYFGLTG